MAFSKTKPITPLEPLEIDLSCCLRRVTDDAPVRHGANVGWWDCNRHSAAA